MQCWHLHGIPTFSFLRLFVFEIFYIYTYTRARAHTHTHTTHVPFSTNHCFGLRGPQNHVFPEQNLARSQYFLLLFLRKSKKKKC
uniref:Putative secreted protein n=1 Tax=Panstrongylus lignarius TaxID=156445 RepID=A0A224XZB9_9HEMI